MMGEIEDDFGPIADTFCVTPEERSQNRRGKHTGCEKQWSEHGRKVSKANSFRSGFKLSPNAHRLALRDYSGGDE